MQVFLPTSTNFSFYSPISWPTFSIGSLSFHLFFNWAAWFNKLCFTRYNENRKECERKEEMACVKNSKKQITTISRGKNTLRILKWSRGPCSHRFRTHTYISRQTFIHFWIFMNWFETWEKKYWKYSARSWQLERLSTWKPRTRTKLEQCITMESNPLKEAKIW